MSVSHKKVCLADSTLQAVYSHIELGRISLGVRVFLLEYMLDVFPTVHV